LLPETVPLPHHSASTRAVPSKTTPLAHIGSAEMPFKLYDTTQTAEILGIGRRGVQEKVASRELACIKIGRSIRFSAEDIAAFVERNRVRAIGWKEGK
jgi:excisionase family DNA binding protein